MVAKHDRAQQRRRASGRGVRDRVDQRAAADRQQRRRQARGELVHAEHGHGRRGQPDGQRRLAPERRAVVELRHQPVAGLEHLARHLGVARFGWIGQRVRGERREAQNDDAGEQRPEEALLPAREVEGYGHGGARSSAGAGGSAAGSTRCTK